MLSDSSERPCYATAMSKETRYTLPVVVQLLLVKDDKVLLMRRQNTGWGDGDYDLVAGHIDGHETLTAALCREAREEIGITIMPKDAHFSHLLHYVDDTEYMYVYFTVKDWQGIPSIQEPHKCDDLQWFSLSKLPSNILEATKGVLEKYKTDNLYTELEFARN
jgi:8-oxo-dGTP diphosphatase